MSKAIKIRKGLNIPIVGNADKVLTTLGQPEVIAIRPPDFHGLTPKLLVKEGQRVQAGEVIFHDKYNAKINYVSPVSGEVKAIVRGEKRRILEVVISADKENSYVSYESADVNQLDGEKIKERLLESGLWPFIKMRPFDVVANPEDKPKAIFVTGFDSSPLAPSYDYILHGKADEFQAGLTALSKLTEGKLHLNLKGGIKHDEALTNAKNVQINTISGPHPAGNVGIQIHHLDPISQGEVIWVVNPQDVAIIGSFFKTGKFNATKVIAVTGEGVKQPKYYKTIIGAPIKQILKGAIESENNRIINGNVLSGEKTSEEGYLGFFSNQITVVPEGNQYQFVLTKGWLSLGFSRHSVSRAYPSWLMPGKKYKMDTNLNGEERSFVMTGQYEKVFPMDIYPVHLIKSIMYNDIDEMEKLGIYEVAPEDFALCEYVCTSKMNVQNIVRAGLDVVKEECM